VNDLSEINYIDVIELFEDGNLPNSCWRNSFLL